MLVVESGPLLSVLVIFLMVLFLGSVAEYFLERDVQPATFGSVPAALWWAVVTLTTTGYGNLVPAGNPGQSLAVVEALMGQLFLVTAVGKIVTAWRPKGWQDESSPDPDPSPA